MGAVRDIASECDDLGLLAKLIRDGLERLGAPGGQDQSGAVARQKYAAHEVQRGLFLIGARGDVADARALSDDNAFGVTLLGAAPGQTLRVPADSPKLKDLAATLAERIRVIKDDEHVGVRHEVGATNGC